MKTQLRTLGLAVALGMAPMMALAADDAAATADAVADTAAAPAAAAEPSGEGGKSFRMTINANGSDGADAAAGESARGVTITVDTDEENGKTRVDMAGKVVERIIADIEKSLEGLPEDVRRDIDAEDLEELHAALEDIRELKTEKRIVRTVKDDGFDPDVIPGIVAIVLLFGGPVVIVALVSYNRRRTRQMVHETIDRIIAQGKDVPVELLDKLDKGRNGRSMLSRGATNVALGLGIAGFLWGVGGDEAASLGLIWICLGVGQLVVWKLEGNGKSSQDATSLS